MFTEEIQTATSESVEKKSEFEKNLLLEQKIVEQSIQIAALQEALSRSILTLSTNQILSPNKSPKEEGCKKHSCPITQLIMREPVFTCDGHTYEREAIEGWLQTDNTSPKTGLKLDNKNLTPNWDKKSDIDEFLAEYPELFEEDEVYLPKAWVIEFANVIRKRQSTEIQNLFDKDRRLLTQKFENDQTVLHIAAEFGCMPIFKFFPQTKFIAPINEVTISGNTPLHLAANAGHKEVILLLLHSGADHTIKNTRGKTAADVAQNSRIANLITQTASVLSAPQEKLERLEQNLKEQSAQIAELKGAPQHEQGKELLFSSKLELELEETSPEVVKTFLKLVTEGEQDKAEAMLKQDSSLACRPSDVTDLSGRFFEGITGFQYAVWALDWHMWTMILKYLPQDQAAEQIKAMESGSWVSQHRKSGDWLIQNLVDALRKFIDLCDAALWDKLDTQWQKQVGRAQRLLPVHVINEYCHPDRPFDPCPDFTKSDPLPRTRKVDQGEWFTASHNAGWLFAAPYGKLGEKFAVLRYRFAWAVCQVRDGRLGVVTWVSVVGADHKAGHTLLATRTQQRDQLVAELSNKRKISP